MTERNSQLAVRANLRRVVGASVAIAIATIGAKSVGFIKELVVADTFGVSESLDRYLLAFIVPSFAANVLTSPILPLLVPLLMARGGGRMSHLLAAAWLRLTAIRLSWVAVVIGVGAGLIHVLTGSFGTEYLIFLWISLPILVLTGLNAVVTSSLNARDRFVEAAASPVAISATAIVFVLLLGQRWGVFGPAVGMTVGFGLQFIWLMSRDGKWRSFGMVRRETEIQKPRLQGDFVALGAGSLMIAGMEVIDRLMASALGSGSVSSLYYGQRIPDALIGLGAVVVGQAVLPTIAAELDTGHREVLKTTILRLLGWIFGIGATIAVLAAVLSPPIVRILFERGAFEAADTAVVSAVMATYILQLPFHLGAILMARTLTTAGFARSVLFVSVALLFVNVIGNFVLGRLFGIAGIAASTSLVFVVSFALTSALVFRSALEPSS